MQNSNIKPFAKALLVNFKIYSAHLHIQYLLYYIRLPTQNAVVKTQEYEAFKDEKKKIPPTNSCFLLDFFYLCKLKLLS